MRRLVHAPSRPHDASSSCSTRMLAGRADSRCARRSLTKLSDIGSVDSQHVGAALAGERRWALSEDEQLQLYEKEKGLLGLFVVGAPASITYNIETGRGLVNGCDATILAHAGQRREQSWLQPRSCLLSATSPSSARCDANIHLVLVGSQWVARAHGLDCCEDG